MDYVVGWIMWLDGLCGRMDFVVGMNYMVGWIMWLAWKKTAKHTAI
jgi:hypothetical protein